MWGRITNIWLAIIRKFGGWGGCKDSAVLFVINRREVADSCGAFVCELSAGLLLSYNWGLWVKAGLLAGLLAGILALVLIGEGSEG